MPFKFVHHITGILSHNFKSNKKHVEERNEQCQSSSTQMLSTSLTRILPTSQSVAFSTNNDLDCCDDHILPRMVIFSVYGEPPPPPSAPSSIPLFSQNFPPPPPPPSAYSLSQSSIYMESVHSITSPPSPPPPSLHSLSS